MLHSDLPGLKTEEDVYAVLEYLNQRGLIYQELPFEMVVAALQPERQTSRMPLFQVKLVLQNYPLDQLETPGLTLTPVPVPIRTSKYDLLFNINENNRGLAGTLEYDTELFDAVSISQLLRQYEAVLRQVVAQPEIRLTMLARSLVESEEQQSTTEANQLAETNLLKLRGIKRRPVAG
jgi:non-ribosomal peptide synthetase component F